MFVAFFGLVLLMLWDIRFLKRMNKSAFTAACQMPPSILLTICMLFLFVLAASPDRPDIFPGYFIAFMLPLYVFRRRKIFKMIKLKEITPDAPDFRNRLAFEAASVVYYWFLGLVVFSVDLKIFVTIYPEYNTIFFQMILLSFLSSCYLFALVCFSARSFSSAGIFTNLKIKMVKKSWMKVFLAPVLLGLVFAFFSASIVSQRTIQPNTPLSEVVHSIPNSKILSVLLILIATLLAPLFEEVIFRGYFFHVLKEYKSKLFAIFFISFFFGVLHFQQYWGDWAAMSFVMLLGFALTSVRALTGSTTSTVVMHYVYNIGVIVIAGVLMYHSNPAYYEFVVYQKNLDVEKQIALLEESVRVQPDWAFAYNDLAQVYVSKDIQLEKALVLAEKAMELDPHKPAFIQTKIEILFELDRILEARALRDHMFDQYPDWGKQMTYDYLDATDTD
ncbi:MAG: CPBP family intramembrane metalloprotease [Candidatus Omnitrophica bacterium]|nr:CPBP family intramembrane metalloprotease [Candidatus Omnitrophota bacterium]